MCMSSSTGFSYSLPEEFLLLCMLHNVGATASEKSLTIEEICKWTLMETSALRLHLQKLTELGYVQLIKAEGVDKYHVTPSGITKVLTLYS